MVCASVVDAYSWLIGRMELMRHCEAGCRWTTCRTLDGCRRAPLWRRLGLLQTFNNNENNRIIMCLPLKEVVALKRTDVGYLTRHHRFELSLWQSRSHPSSLSDVCPSISDRYSSSHSMNLRFPPSLVNCHLILRILFAKLRCDIRAVRTPRMTCRRSSALSEYSAVKWSAIWTAVRSNFCLLYTSPSPRD